MKIPQIYEDDNLTVINKPAGVVVNKAASVKEETIQEWAEQKFQIPQNLSKYPDDFYQRSGIVHRIDKETSGILIIAKNENAFTNLQAQFKERVVKKKYICLVHGKMDCPQGEIKASIGRLPWNRERFGILPGGREATSFYETKDVFLQDKEYYSLLLVSPLTGRTHQIRVHMKYINHPIVSDSLYGGRKTYRKDSKWCPRLFLHATYLQIKNPADGKNMEFDCPLSEDLETAITVLEKVA